MTLGEVRILLGNAKYQIAGAAAKDAINTMIEQIEDKVLAGEQVELTFVTHKKNGIVYLICDAVAVEGTKFVCVALYGSETKVYAASTLKRMFKKEVETLEVPEEELPEVPNTVNPAAVDTDDKAADDPELTNTVDPVPAVPAVPEVTVNPEVADKTEKPAESDPEVPQTPAAGNTTYITEDYKFFKNKTNKLAAEIIKYFCSRGYEAQIVCDYVKLFKGKRCLSKLYFSKKGDVRMAINPVCEQAFKSCFPVNYYSFVKAWTLGMKVFIAANDDLRTIHKFLSMVDKLHSEKYGKEVC